MRTPGVLAGAGVLVSLLVAAPAVAAPSPPPDATPQVMAQAIIKPSIVYLTTTWRGWVRFADGNLLSDTATEVSTSCSGFVANPTGYIVTAGHCVDDQTMDGGKGLILEAALQAQIDAGRITAAQGQALLPVGRANWKVEGKDSGAPPDRTVSVYQTVAASGIAQIQPLAASVVDVKALGDGDVALLKVEAPNPMPALQIAPAGADDGTDVLSAGYPGSVDGVTDFKLEPSFKDGQISSQQTVNGVPFTEISAANSPGMSGGPTVDMQGRVLGTVSFKNSGETQAFNFITATSTVQELLSRNAVANTLTPTDQAYRTGLGDYFTGRYREAVTQFSTVLQSEPNHQQAQVYRGKALALESTEPTPTNGWVLVAGLAGAVLVVVLVVVLVLLLAIRRRRAGPVLAGPYAPTWPPPPTAPMPALGMPPAHVSAVPMSPGPYTTAPLPPPTTTPPLPPTPAPAPPTPANPSPGAPPGGETSTAPPPTVVPVLATAPTQVVAGTCSGCGSPYQPDAAFCWKCGRPLAG